MKVKVLLTLFLGLFLSLLEGYSLVTVYIGDHLPAYTETALAQARLFNPESTIYLLANQNALDEISLDTLDITCIPLEKLKASASHLKFRRFFKGFGRRRKPFWKYTTERFFYLEEFSREQQLTDLFHIELDNMIYCELKDLLPVLHTHYPEAAITFDNDARAIAGFIYFADHTVLERLTEYMANVAYRGLNDMQSIAEWSIKSKYRSTHFLPVMTACSIQGKKRLFSSQEAGQAKKPENYIAHIEDFEGIFDPAPIGQWFLGQDPIHGITGPGTHINPYSVVAANKMSYVWIEDEEGRSIPYAKDGGKLRRIHNLHIHSKMLEKVSSLIPAEELNAQLP